MTSSNASILTSLQIDLHKLYMRTYSEKDPNEVEIFDCLKQLAVSARYSLTEQDVDSAVDRYTKLISISLSQNARNARGQECEFAPIPEVNHRWPVVLTSINPFGRTEVQLSCFKRWCELGYEVFSCNSVSEIDLVVALGVDPSQVIRLSEAETGLALHGKAVPKIISVLEKAASLFDRDVLLVNSDLFPDTEDSGFAEAWQASGVAMALVREDQLSRSVNVSGLSKPYTNGLDAFLLPRDRLASLLKKLKLFEVSERMCFGMVGWDFLMGALILRNGGSIRESGVLVHEYHKPTYSEISEFEHYNNAMHILGISEGTDFLETAANFAQIIENNCAASRGTFQVTRAKSKTAIDGLSTGAQQAYLLIKSSIPTLVLSLGCDNVIGLAKIVDNRRDLSLSEIFSNLNQAEVKLGFSLRLLVFIFRIKSDVGTVLRFSPQYPDGSKHAEALRHLRKIHSKDLDLLRNSVAELFLLELYEYRIFNYRIFNFLALTCENDSERALLRMIGDLAQEGTINAA